MTKMRRSPSELVSALERHLHLLSDYYRQCFINRNTNYFGEVAGKLRLLVCDKKNNQALLMHVARHYGVASKYRINKEAKITETGEGLTIEEYLNRTSVTVNIDGEMVPVTNRDEILMYGEKEGAAHEDLDHPEIMYKLKEIPLILNDMNMHQIKIENTASYVMEIGKKILRDIQEGRV